VAGDHRLVVRCPAEQRAGHDAVEVDEEEVVVAAWPEALAVDGPSHGASTVE
jgi:hypothetical protein